MSELEKNILQNFYNQNDNPNIEVIIDYERVYAKYFDRKTFLSEGEFITDGFVDMKTTVCLDKLNLDGGKVKAFYFYGGREDSEIDNSKISYFLEKDFQKIIDMNLKKGNDVKIIVSAFYINEGYFHNLHSGLMMKSLLTTYKVERL